QRVANFALPLSKFRRELDGRVEEPVIDGPYLDSNQRPADLAFRGSEPGHAPYHRQARKMRADNNLVNSRTPTVRHKTGSIAASSSRARARTVHREYSGIGNSGSRSRSLPRVGSFTLVNQAPMRRRGARTAS